MSDTDNKPTLGRKPLGLKHSVEAGEVKQTFSHGRTNKVVVEVKRRKVLGGRPDGGTQHVEAAPAARPPLLLLRPRACRRRARSGACRAASGCARASGPAPGARARPSGSASHSQQ
jgi:translation initiation factor IF-2